MILFRSSAIDFCAYGCPGPIRRPSGASRSSGIELFPSTRSDWTVFCGPSTTANVTTMFRSFVLNCGVTFT